MKTGQLIRKLRIKNNMTQAELAKSLRSHPQFVCLIETGKSKLPASSLSRVAKALKVNRNVLAKQMVQDYKSELMS